METNNIKRLIGTDFPGFKREVRALYDTDLISLRRYLQKEFNDIQDREGKEWLEFVDEVAGRDGRFPTDEERGEFYKERGSALPGLLERLRFVKNEISDRSKKWLEDKVKELEKRYGEDDGLFIAIDFETREVFTGYSRDEALAKARFDNPDAYLYFFAIGERYQTVLK